MHVSQTALLRESFGLRPLPAPLPESPPPEATPCGAAGRGGEGAGGHSYPNSPFPHKGEGVRGSGALSSWDPGVFRPEGPVSCYSREIFFGELKALPVSAKPGGGFKKPECGRWVRKLRSGNQVRDIYHNCGALSCPVCMPGVITEKGRDVQSRFDLYEQAKIVENAVLVPGERRGVTPRQFIFTISPAHQAELVARVWRKAGRWDDGLFLEYVREEFNQGLKISGLIGGFSVYHDARVRHPDTGTTGSRAKHLIIMEAKSTGFLKDEDPAWKMYDYIRTREKPWEYYYFSPHFHVIAFGKAIDASEFERLLPGWTYHNKGPAKNPGGLARYLISHMAIIDDKKACSWFGRLSSKTLGKTELRTYDRVEICQETGQPWIVEKSVIPEEEGREYRVSVTEWQGFFRKRERKRIQCQPFSIDLMKKYALDDWPSVKFEEPKPLKFPGSKRRAGPLGLYEKGILAMAKYCDEFGRL